MSSRLRPEPHVRVEPLEGFLAAAKVRGFPALYLDEPEGLGGGNTAPSPFDYLLLAVGGCLSASLTLCLRKKRLQVPFAVELEGRIDRDSDGLLRVEQIQVRIVVSAAEEDRKKVEGCYGIFKKYCTVSASVARGIPVETSLSFEESGAR